MDLQEGEGAGCSRGSQQRDTAGVEPMDTLEKGDITDTILEPLTEV